MLTNVAHLIGLSAARNMEAAPRFGIWKRRRALERGNLDTMNGELVTPNRDRLYQCVADQRSE